MATTDTASRLTPYLEQLLENEEAQKNLRRGADKLRAAYERSQKRRVKTVKDRKLRRQLKSAAKSLGEGAEVLVKGTHKPKKRRGRRLLTLATLGAVGAGVALATNDELRASLFGSGSEPINPQGGQG